MENIKAILWGPFLVCLTLITLPYVAYDDDNFFFFIPRVDLADHLIFAFLFSVASFLLYFKGVRTAYSSSLRQTRWFVGADLMLLIEGLKILCILAYIVLLLIGARYVFSGDFVSAREAFDFPGVGIPLRSYIVFMPVYFAISPMERRPWCLLWAFVFLAVMRSLILSERLSAIEGLVTLFVCASICGVRISFIKVVASGFAVLILFATIHYARMEFQASTDKNAMGIVDKASLGDSLVAYYADTTNKFYLIALGDLHYPYVFVTDAFSALFQERTEHKRGMNDFLKFDAPGDGSVNQSLNNPGGLAQDISDFGYIFGSLVIATRFFLAGFCIGKGAFDNRFKCVLPLAIISVLEYPRFNYIHLSFGMGLVVLCVLIVFSYARSDAITR
jgi:hypothetical protein